MKIHVQESEYKEEYAFVDADELPELIRAIDALIAPVESTSFQNFEVHYTTRGSLKLVAFNNMRGNLEYSIEAGKLTKASTFTDAKGPQALKDAFLKAQQKLDTIPK